MEYSPCEYIDCCELRTCYAVDKRDDNNNELHRVFGCAIACKRDNADFVPMTREELYEMYQREKDIQESFEEVYENFLRLGIVQDR